MNYIHIIPPMPTATSLCYLIHGPTWYAATCWLGAESVVSAGASRYVAMAALSELAIPGV